jgi:SAM-dependent methyltransferase
VTPSAKRGCIDARREASRTQDVKIGRVLGLRLEASMSDQGQWQVVGSAAETYERALIPAVFAAWTPLVVELAEPRAGERVLDVACGTGVVARLAAQQVGRTGKVVGLDLNPGMLAVAAARAAGEPPTSASITWQEANAARMPFPDAAFDVAYCQLGLQFFPDRPAALREMNRVLGRSAFHRSRASYRTTWRGHRLRATSPRHRMKLAPHPSLRWATASGPISREVCSHFRSRPIW